MSTKPLSIVETRSILLARYLYLVLISVRWLLTSNTYISHTRPITKLWSWDSMISIPAELKIFSGRRLAAVDIVYILSRYILRISSVPMRANSGLEFSLG